MPELREIWEDQISIILIFRHFDIILHFRVIDLPRNSIALRIFELIRFALLFLLLLRRLNGLRADMSLQVRISPQEIHVPF